MPARQHWHIRTDFSSIYLSIFCRVNGEFLPLTLKTKTRVITTKGDAPLLQAVSTRKSHSLLLEDTLLSRSVYFVGDSVHTVGSEAVKRQSKNPFQAARPARPARRLSGLRHRSA